MKTTIKSAFTLIELLVVISIIAVLAAFTVPVIKGVKRSAYLMVTKTEMAKIETALDYYKSKHGIYPPSGTNCLSTPLYMELCGTKATGMNAYALLTGEAANPILGGFINCTRDNGEDYPPANDCLKAISSKQVWHTDTNTFLLISSIQGLGTNIWRYETPKDSDTYRLWIQLVINGKTNLVSNWSKDVRINSGEK